MKAAGLEVDGFGKAASNSYFSWGHLITEPITTALAFGSSFSMLFLGHPSIHPSNHPSIHPSIHQPSMFLQFGSSTDYLNLNLLPIFPAPNQLTTPVLLSAPSWRLKSRPRCGEAPTRQVKALRPVHLIFRGIGAGPSNASNTRGREGW